MPSSDQIASASSSRSSRISGRERQAPGGVHAAAVGREDAEAPVADLVAEALDDDRLVGGDDAGRGLLLAQVGDQVLGRAAVEVVLGRPAPSGLRETASRAKAPIARPSSAGRPIPSPFQKGTAPGTPGAGVTITRSRVISSIRQVVAPSRKVWPGRAS